MLEIKENIFEAIQNRGVVTFDEVLTFLYRHKWTGKEREVKDALDALVESQRITKYRVKSGMVFYRDFIETHREEPVKRMSLVSDPEGAQKLLDDVISGIGKDEFTINLVKKAQHASDNPDKFSQNKIRDLVLELEAAGKIKATRSAKHFKNTFNYYKVVGEIKRKPRKLGGPKWEFAKILNLKRKGGDRDKIAKEFNMTISEVHEQIGKWLDEGRLEMMGGNFIVKE